jgi:DNA-binding NarL/FixJ family response regulator
MPEGAARVLRESGVTPAQMKVGIQLALGKTKPVIADELGIQLSSIVDVTKKLYQNLDVHNSAELERVAFSLTYIRHWPGSWRIPAL